MSFISLGLSGFFQRALDEQGYEAPTAIQAQAIPAVISGRDLLAAAETGSGKTAAYVLPLLEILQSQDAPASNCAAVLVLVPTRELALQVETSIKSYSRYMPRRVTSLAVYGGVSINTQMQALRGGCDLVIATPGRLLDLVEKNAVKLNQVRHLILDEADRMLDLGFAEELQKVLSLLPPQRQNLLFSATFPEEVDALIDKLLFNPVTIEIERKNKLPESLTQRAIEVDTEQRTSLLRYLLSQHSGDQFLVFVASKRAANNVAIKLNKAGFNADTLHGDMSQIDRNGALQSFKAGQTQVLIATDLAARGIDIPLLPFVVNYDLPRSPADYIHRIGRTARAGEAGTAFSFIDHSSDAHFELIVKRNQLTIDREQIPGFERNSTPPPEALQPTKGPQPIKGKRKSKKDKLREAAERSKAYEGRQGSSIWSTAKLKSED
ncbi:DEAD/DEAH box helicase [Oceanospirillum maris]|uniref:DEAD/DEAH box helicase n=1 Tax=Oceanospirillum maris TaxID=64977 RepID=UPI0004159845|nr:DEAD/DEAH box helicase [Oceanospirillum maris]